MDGTEPGVPDATSIRQALRAIGSNLALAWHPEARALFARIDDEAFEATGRNPLAFAEEASDELLARVAADSGLAGEVERVRSAIAAEATPQPHPDRLLVAYFSAEFGVDESLPIYSGGLGVLAGDHLKSSSELAVPLVGVGLLYGNGYFRQSIDDDGRQVEWYPLIEPARRPIALERDAAGEPVAVRIELAGERVLARVWRAEVGRTRLYLLDTNVEGNSDAARTVTSSALYGGDRELRIRQEMVLGVGGVRALEALGLEATVFHMNEGHSAFLAVERIRALVASGVALDDAVEIVRSSTVFTTHTPVPAGNEVFDHELVRRYVGPLVDQTGLGWEEFLAFGRANVQDAAFGLTPLALHTSGRANGVSRLHAEVSRRMWHDLWPERRVEDVAIGHVTNGVHARTWLAAELQELLRAHGVRPEAPPAEQGWENALGLPLDELDRIHRVRKGVLMEFLRRRRRDPEAELDPHALTVGFARRFASYKRADLLLSDPERLQRLLRDADRPLQLVIAGKAHPADGMGKDLIHRVVGFARGGGNGRVVFLENYGLAAARQLVRGVDVWLNTPRRPLEASGTSGMKAGMNGVLNCSILDGWWAEGYSPELGWAIDGGEGDEETQDARDAEALFALLEQQVVPLFYEDRGRWLEMMRASVARVGAVFNTHRMVTEYLDGYYLPAHRETGALLAELRRAA